MSKRRGIIGMLFTILEIGGASIALSPIEVVISPYRNDGICKTLSPPKCRVLVTVKWNKPASTNRHALFLLENIYLHHDRSTETCDHHNVGDAASVKERRAHLYVTHVPIHSTSGLCICLVSTKLMAQLQIFHFKTPLRTVGLYQIYGATPDFPLRHHSALSD